MRPKDVPGFAQAREQGLIRSAPETPPPLVSGVNAQRQFFGMIGRVAVVATLVLPVVKVLDAVGLPAVLQLVVPIAAFIVILRLFASVGRTVHRELDHGYATLRLSYGSFFAKPRLATPMARRVPWDYRGLWILGSRDGRVLQAPDPTVEPPGFYPSPNRPGAFEMWTGAAWTSDFRTVEKQARAMRAVL